MSNSADSRVICRCGDARPARAFFKLPEGFRPVATPYTCSYPEYHTIQYQLSNTHPSYYTVQCVPTLSTVSCGRRKAEPLNTL
jgi:hypothetical protein